MANTKPPPYPGFTPNIAPSASPYPQQYVSEQKPYPLQQYRLEQQSYPGQQYRLEQQPYPGLPPRQQYVNQGDQHPQVHFSPNVTVNPGFSAYEPPFATTMPDATRFPDDESMDDEQNIVSDWGTSFSDKAIRAVFIRKVYAILMVQLLFSFAVVALFVFEKNTKNFVRRNPFLYYISYFLFLAIYITLACSEHLRRSFPANMILLSIFTICMSYMLGTISSYFDTDVVFLAIGICAGICLAVSVFSFHTKFDFTSCGGVLLMLVWALFLFGIIAIFKRHQILVTVYAGCGALVFTLFLAYDTQLLMGGKKLQLSPEEHIFAAMQIYIDVVYTFIYLLLIFGIEKK